MKLCPYPFSRMQTKNDQLHTEDKGAFFPCCPSWFNQSYWDLGFEKNLDDIWNGKAAIELRKRMYEGDYSLCNRNECKIPLLSVEELSNPDITFIETPISQENLEAIKEKNPVMPKQPSSLHLVADLRCNLKCPTCRPEIISNKSESIEAEEEYELVQRLKDDVEIVKMSSSGEVFYSQTQRRLLKSFNKDDFPRLRRIHIVSNGTLFNQKTYNDLLPGTSYIKDISISLDAGSKEVYEKLRGPYWEQVVSNLEWIGQMRKSGKFEYLTLNCTLIRDNYRDIPNLVALGKKYGVDRILIQKYNFANNQGYKTLKEQEEQAVHDPSHPEHIHMLRTLEMFKDEPLVHTLLELEGFGQKIEDHVRLRKGLVEIKKLIPVLENGDFLQALNIINEMFDSVPLGESHLREVGTQFRTGVINLDTIPSLVDYPAFSSQTKELHSLVIARLIDSIFKFQSSGRHLETINTFIILSHFHKAPAKDILHAVSTSLKSLSRFEEATRFLQMAVNASHEDFSEGRRTSEVHYYFNRDLGFFYQQNKKYKLAVEAFGKSLDHGPGDADMYFSMGVSLKRQNRYGEATKYFVKALEERSDHYYALMELGVIELLEGRRKAALILFSIAKDVEPEGRKAFGDKMIKLASRQMAFGRAVSS